MAKPQIQKLIEAGAQFSEVSRKQAEDLVSSLVKAGEVRRNDADALIQTLVERGKQTSEQILALIQRETAKQIAVIAARFDDLEDNVEDLAAQVRSMLNQQRGARPKVEARPAGTSSTKKKAATKKATTKKKAATKKATTKKRAATKKTSSAVGPSGVRKVSTSRDG
jgi:polyhydroxyalkanoate synthesis regulator phasin